MEAKQSKPTDKTERQLYMREYMRNRYQKNSEKACNERKAYYYKKKYNLEPEEVKKYGEHLHLIIKAKKLIDEIKTVCPQHLAEIHESHN